MTLRKQIRDLLADIPPLTTHEFVGDYTLDSATLEALPENESIDIHGAPGDSLTIHVDCDLTYTVNDPLSQSTGHTTVQMVLIPARVAARYEAMMTALHEMVSLRGLLTEEYGKERAEEMLTVLRDAFEDEEE